MSNSFEAVFVKFYGGHGPRTYMFRAPSYSDIDVGDEVILDTTGPDTRGTVVAVEHYDLDYSTDRKNFELLCTVLGATTPLNKVLCVVKLKELEYEEEDD